MNTPPQNELHIQVVNLGPIQKLDAQLSKSRQNLVYAPNGTGKSFLAKAFRYLDQQAQGITIENAERDLLREENAKDGGSICLKKGQTELKKLELSPLPATSSEADDFSIDLDLPSDSSMPVDVDRHIILHVFTEDFVQAELREREFKVNDEITNEITLIDSNNIELVETERKLDQAQSREKDARGELEESFNKERDEKLKQHASKLKAYKEIRFENVLTADRPAFDENDRSLSQIVEGLQELDGIEESADLPKELSFFDIAALRLDEVQSRLSIVTSPSQVAEHVKAKIDANKEFFRQGVKIIEDSDGKDCPLCGQDITSPNPKAVIDAYVEYFGAAEEKHKQSLEELILNLSEQDQKLERFKVDAAQQRETFNTFKAQIPSQKDIELERVDETLADVKAGIHQVQQMLKEKSRALSRPIEWNFEQFAALWTRLTNTIEQCNRKLGSVKEAYDKRKKEHLTLRNEACDRFVPEFVDGHWDKIERLKTLQRETQQYNNALAEIKKKQPSQNARERVADTFELLLKYFFLNKYTFDRKNFVLRRGEEEMRRGAHRTLSDGEKTVIAFCYFIASAHKKVRNNEEYKKLFWVFDDPVTSLSYDYVFSIAQLLKYLRVHDGKILIDPESAGRIPRLEFLLLTHSTYFFNILSTNNVVNKYATFALQHKDDTHELTQVENFVLPFQHQVEHICKVAEGSEGPDHTTGNTVRAILESVGRFCHPDKATDLRTFVDFLSAEKGFTFSNSILVNFQSHGFGFEQAGLPAELVQACKEALEILEHYCPGQVALFRG